MEETIENLVTKPEGVYVDCTLGGCGHALRVIERLNEKAWFIGIDQDPTAISVAKERLAGAKCRIDIVNSNFSNLVEVLNQLKVESVDGFLFDLGVSSHQLDKAERGFSYMQDARLDMRMNPNDSLSAYEVVNKYEEENLAVLSTESDKGEQGANIEANFLEATFIYNELSANLQVFGSNSSLTGANPANIDLGLQHINRCLEVEPNNPKYLNLKGLLLAQGKTELQEGLKLIEKAAELDPTDINIQHNLKTLKDPNGCFIATAAYGTPFVYEIEELRNWRDRSLSKTSYGKIFIRNYYKYSPPFANYISEKKNLKKAVRILLKPLIRYAKFANRK